MFFWNSLHQVCSSGIAFIRCALLVEFFKKNMPDENYSRRTYLMKAIPEEHT
jgi:hypothetical protein